MFLNKIRKSNKLSKVLIVKSNYKNLPISVRTFSFIQLNNELYFSRKELEKIQNESKIENEQMIEKNELLQEKLDKPNNHIYHIYDTDTYGLIRFLVIAGSTFLICSSIGTSS